MPLKNCSETTFVARGQEKLRQRGRCYKNLAALAVGCLLDSCSLSLAASWPLRLSYWLAWDHCATPFWAWTALERLGWSLWAGEGPMPFFFLYVVFLQVFFLHVFFVHGRAARWHFSFLVLLRGFCLDVPSA